MTGRPQADLDGPPLPPPLAYLWDLFVRISSGRQGGGFGPSPIAWAEFESFFRLHRIVPESWEMDLLRRLDGIALSAR